MGGKWVGGRLVGGERGEEKGKEVRNMSIKSQKKTGRRGKRDQKWVRGTLARDVKII